jgi:hypothetical protein
VKCRGSGDHRRDSRAKSLRLVQRRSVMHHVERWATKMNVRAEPEAVERLWREALWDNRPEKLRERLSEKWPGETSVNSIAYRYPPSFQPGYVGPRYFASTHRILLVCQNPGEGRAAVSVDRDYSAALEAFAEGEIGFEELNGRVAWHMLRWSVFNGKGIFRESDAGRIALLDEDVRPSIEAVAYLNFFPYKTSRNEKPPSSFFQQRVWKTYVRPLVDLLASALIIPMGVSWFKGSVEAELRATAGSAEIIPVLHPADRNINTRRPQLQASWTSLSEYLGGLAD